jgi:hypothetical protein
VYESVCTPGIQQTQYFGNTTTAGREEEEMIENTTPGSRKLAEA